MKYNNYAIKLGAKLRIIHNLSKFFLNKVRYYCKITILM